MKICLLGDTHWGARGDSHQFHEYFIKFFDFMFDTLKEREIYDVYQFGDLFDKRKQINFQTLTWMKEHFLDKFNHDVFNLKVFLGNHDIFYKNTTDVNAFMLLRDQKSIRIYEENQTVNFDDGTSIDLIPWVTPDDLPTFYKFVEKSTADYMFGHLEISGFAMSKHMTSQGGIKSNVFKQYKHVYSGHYHHPSTKGNITYLGAPYELTWEDHDDPKGFYIFDTTTGELEFIQNPYSMYHKILYNDELTDYTEFDFSKLQGSIVKLIVVKKQSTETFENLIDDLEKCNLIELQIIDDDMVFVEQNIDDIEVENTLAVMMKNIDGVEADDDIKLDDIKHLTQEIYYEALDVSRTTA